MTPQVYCARLERALSLMPAAERQETIRYYLEFLEDASEEERAALGTPEALAQQILRENGISPQPAVIKHSNRTAKLIVLACTFYIWLPLLVTWYSLLLTALIVLICIVGVDGLGSGGGSGGVGILVAYPIWLACKGIVRFTIFTTKKMLHFVLKGDETQ